MAAPPPLPNPETPLAFLPPTLARQFEVSRYLHVATCGMFAWDILTNLHRDWILLTKYRFNLPTLAYFVSRIATCAYLATGTVFSIGEVGDCQKLQVVIGITFAIAVPATSLLFFLRVRAIFSSNIYVIALFAFLWVATLAGTITVPFGITGAHIGPTPYCINTVVKPFSSAGVVIATVNDTLVFIFISYRLLAASSLEETFSGRFRSFFYGQGLPRFSRSLLQSGQQYYLITVGWNILTTGMILAPATVPPPFHAMFTDPNLAIACAMACKVYRDVKFGLLSEGGSTVVGSSGKSLPPLMVKKRFETHTDTSTAFALSGISGNTMTHVDVESGHVKSNQTYDKPYFAEEGSTTTIPMNVILPPKEPSYS